MSFPIWRPVMATKSQTAGEISFQIMGSILKCVVARKPLSFASGSLSLDYTWLNQFNFKVTYYTLVLSKNNLLDP